jgi:hypothetical protein
VIRNDNVLASGPRTTGSPSDFPTEDELRRAILADELVERIADVEISELVEVLAEFAAEEDRLYRLDVDHRLDSAFPTGRYQGRIQ